MKCEIEGCCNKKRRKSSPYCSKHFTRFYRHKNPLAVYPYKMTLEEAKVSMKRSQKKYNKTIKGKVASKRKIHKRRHLSLSDVILSTEDYQEIYASFNDQCFKCGTTSDLTFDHHIPLSEGRKFVINNNVLLCRVCNGKNSDSDPKDFYTSDELIRLSLFNE